MNLEQTTKDLTWATVVSLLGLPADPRWGKVVLGEMRKHKLIRRLEGIGCDPAVVIGTREDFMTRMGQARAVGLLPFPEKNGPVGWPQYTMHDGESSFALCDRLSRTRDNRQRQLPTDHDYAVPTREYQTDQSSLNLLRLLLALSSRKEQVQQHPTDFAPLTRSLHIRAAF